MDKCVHQPHHITIVCTFPTVIFALLLRRKKQQKKNVLESFFPYRILLRD